MNRQIFSDFLALVRNILRRIAIALGRALLGKAEIERLREEGYREGWNRRDIGVVPFGTPLPRLVTKEVIVSGQEKDRWRVSPEAQTELEMLDRAAIRVPAYPR